MGTFKAFTALGGFQDQQPLSLDAQMKRLDSKLDALVQGGALTAAPFFSQGYCPPALPLDPAPPVAQQQVVAPQVEQQQQHAAAPPVEQQQQQQQHAAGPAVAALEGPQEGQDCPASPTQQAPALEAGGMYITPSGQVRAVLLPCSHPASLPVLLILAWFLL